MNVKTNTRDVYKNIIFDGYADTGKTRLASEKMIISYKEAMKAKENSDVLVLNSNQIWKRKAEENLRSKINNFRFSMHSDNILKLNILRIPKNTNCTKYFNIITENLCLAYGFSAVAKSRLEEILYNLYEKYNVFSYDEESKNNPNWGYEHSGDITLTDFCEELKKKLKICQEKSDKLGSETFTLYINRLSPFSNSKANEYKLLCNKGGESLDFLLNQKGFTIMNSEELSNAGQNLFLRATLAVAFEQAVERKSNLTIVLEDADYMLNTEKIKANDYAVPILEKLKDSKDEKNKKIALWVLLHKISSISPKALEGFDDFYVGRTIGEDDK